MHRETKQVLASRRNFYSGLSRLDLQNGRFSGRKSHPMLNRTILAVIFGVALSAGRDSMAADAGNPDLLAHIHFAGTARIAADPNASKLNEIAALPASRDLREATLQKLATAPYRFLEGKLASKANNFSTEIRSMLEDLAGAESCLELRGTTNPVPELLLAVRLDNLHAEAWRKNLSTILASWTGIKPVDIQPGGFKGWELKKHVNPNIVRFIRAGDWVVFGWGQDDLLLQPAILKAIKEKGRPTDELKDNWLEAWLDGPRLTPHLPMNLPVKLPVMELRLQGKMDSARPDGYIREELVMKFPQPLGLTLDPWQIPTNAIHNATNDSLVAFSAFRGIAPWLGQQQPMKELKANPAPNQMFVWAAQQIPFETWFAMPVKGASNYLARIGPGLVNYANSKTAHWGLTSTAEWTTNQEVMVRGNPFFGPHLEAEHGPDGDFLIGGAYPKLLHQGPMPEGLIREVMGRPNLVYYGWEITEPRVSHWRALSQLALIIQDKPITLPDTPAQKWIDAIKTKLVNCGTVVTLTGPDQLTAIRNSPIGLNGFEITWLAYWLDAPGFPLDTRYPAASQ
jgi:hypothetical protein